MSDQQGAVRSNVFRVKDTEKFRTWLSQYSFGDGYLKIFDEPEVGERAVCFGCEGQWPVAWPEKAREQDDVGEVDLTAFAVTLCRDHLEPGEMVAVVATGHEKLLYSCFSVLLIDTADPEHPIHFGFGSDTYDHDGWRRLAGLARSARFAEAFPWMYCAE